MAHLAQHDPRRRKCSSPQTSTTPRRTATSRDRRLHAVWEFVSGPLNAGGFGPNPFDATFGPEAVFVKAPPVSNTSPADGFQFFGHVAIDGGSRVMTVSLRDLDGKVLFSVDLEAVGKKADKNAEKKGSKDKSG